MASDLKKLAYYYTTQILLSDEVPKKESIAVSVVYKEPNYYVKVSSKELKWEGLLEDWLKTNFEVVKEISNA